MVWTRIPLSVRSTLTCGPPRRDDPRAWDKIVGEIQRLGKILNQRQIGLDALIKLRDQRLEPRVAARRLLQACGITSTPDGLPESLPFMIKRLYIDVLPPATRAICRIGLANSTFEELVSRAEEAYPIDSDRNEFAAFGINAVSRDKRLIRDGDSDPRNVDLVLAARISKFEDAMKSTNSGRPDSKTKRRRYPSIDKNEPFVCRIHRRYGDKARNCSNREWCQFFAQAGRDQSQLS